MDKFDDLILKFIIYIKCRFFLKLQTDWQVELLARNC